MPRSSASWALLLSLGLAGCGGVVFPGEEGEGEGEDEGGARMRPGEDCLRCHSQGENTLTAAGTVFSKPDDPASAGVAGVAVTLTDAKGQQVQLQTNSAGNFYTRQPLTFPISVELQRGSSVARMSQQVGSGGCASCHSSPPANGAPGRPFVSP